VFLEVSCNEHRIPVELTATGGRRRILLDGREVQCDWVSLPNGQYSIILDGRVFDLSVEVNGETCSVVTRDATYVLRLADRRRSSIGHGVEGGQAGLQRIRADMPGKVVRILVDVGDSVNFDQGLLVLEAMKMQNEIRAPKSGVVKEIGVVEGKAVNSGDLLVSLE
jgi:biotin carboxyl carrier protein